jgi:hypothetical protein
MKIGPTTARFVQPVSVPAIHADRKFGPIRFSSALGRFDAFMDASADMQTFPGLRMSVANRFLRMSMAALVRPVMGRSLGGVLGFAGGR